MELVIGIGFGWVEKVAWPAEELPQLETRLLNEWIRFGIVQARLVRGRVEWTAKGPLGRGIGRTATTISSAGPRCSERISLAGGAENISLSYARENQQQKYSLSVDLQRAFQIQWQSLDPLSPWTIELSQRPGEPVALKVTGAATDRVWRARSLWHLAFEEPGTVQKYVIPLFGSFLPSVSLLGHTEQVQREMLGLAQASRSPDRRRWEALVAQLADEQYTRRQAADRALRQQGPAIVPFLRSLDWNLLDAEQRFRIRRILQALEPPGDEDSLTKVAHWLLDDAEIWWILLDRPDLQTRRIAAQRLAQLLGESIQFDPEAPAELRQVQRQPLETKVRPALQTPR
ncbi:MAG: hypothetical protein RMI90_04305 [Thermoguttaceae bacterium]|nr:hypothetical protein [Thermoguttaceae bacterium]